MSGGSGIAGAVLVVRLQLERTTRRQLAKRLFCFCGYVTASCRHAQKNTHQAILKTYLWPSCLIWPTTGALRAKKVHRPKQKRSGSRWVLI